MSELLIPPALRADPVQLRAAHHLLLLALVTALSAPLLALMYRLLGFGAASVMVGAGGAVMALSPLALRLGVAAARELFLVAFYLLKLWLAFQLGGLAAPTVPWFLLCPMIALLLGGPGPCASWSVMVSASVLLMFAAERVGGHVAAYPVADPQILALVSVLGLIALSTIIVLFFWADTVLARRAR